MSLQEHLAEVEVGISEVDQLSFLTLLAHQIEDIRAKIADRRVELILDKKPPKSDLLSIPTLAARLSVKPATLYRRVARGELPVTRVGRCVRATEEDATRVRAKRTRVTRLA